MTPLTFGSLFAGIGGFDLGFERAGMVCKWQVEIDDYATRVLAKHWPDVKRYRDVRECGAHNLEPVDVICGGFPCQDISYAGLGAGLDGERSSLFFEALRIVREMGPQFFIVENVAAIVARGLDRVLGSLAEIGFDAEWDCLQAKEVGSPQRGRDRLFLVAYPSGLFRDGSEDHRTGGGKRCRVFPESRDSCGGSLWQRCHWQGNQPGVLRVADGISNRVERLKGTGNAVVPQVAEWIGRRIVEAYQSEART